MRKVYSMIVITTLTFFFYSFIPEMKEGIKGWFLAGSNPGNYEIGIKNNRDRGGKVAYLKSIKISNGFGTIMQSFVPKDYLGKRVRLSGFIKSDKVTKWAGMWFRIDGENSQLLGFDNMQNRPIKGTTGWKRYEIVLDMPANSKKANYGVLMSGTGIVLLDDLNFEVVDKSVPVTLIEVRPELNKPSNSNFEESEN